MTEILFIKQKNTSLLLKKMNSLENQMILSKIYFFIYRSEAINTEIEVPVGKISIVPPSKYETSNYHVVSPNISRCNDLKLIDLGPDERENKYLTNRNMYLTSKNRYNQPSSEE